MSEPENDDTCNECGSYNNDYVICNECIDELVNKRAAARTSLKYLGCIVFDFADTGIVTAEVKGDDLRTTFFDEFASFNLAFDAVRDYIQSANFGVELTG